MSTDHPYSQQWRERTAERLDALRMAGVDLAEQTGLRQRVVLDALYERVPVSLEVAGPIDELLDRLEEEREAAALRECVVHHPGVGSPRVRRVEGVDLGALVDCRVVLGEVEP